MDPGQLGTPGPKEGQRESFMPVSGEFVANLLAFDSTFELPGGPYHQSPAMGTPLNILSLQLGFSIAQNLLRWRSLLVTMSQMRLSSILISYLLFTVETNFCPACGVPSVPLWGGSVGGAPPCSVPASPTLHTLPPYHSLTLMPWLSPCLLHSPLLVSSLLGTPTPSSPPTLLHPTFHSCYALLHLLPHLLIPLIFLPSSSPRTGCPSLLPPSPLPSPSLSCCCTQILCASLMAWDCHPPCSICHFCSQE